VQQTSETHWQFSVSDTGIGISEAAQKHIFDRFYQADGSHTRKGEGTGIGLALVKELVELAEGNILLQSEVGKGSAFTVTLPIGQKQVSATMNTAPHAAEYLAPPVPLAPAERQEIAAEEATMVLLVEDNDEMRQYVRMTLESAGYAVREAADGAAGIELAQELIPDLIISDVMMPEKDGFELTETLKQDVRTSHIPIVLLTAKGRLESKIEGYRLGADAYLPKPFYTEELLVRLRQLLEVRRALQLRYTQPPTEASAQLSVAQLTEFEAAELSPLDADFLERVCAYVQARLQNETLNVDTIAEAFSMSRATFHRKVQALTGEPPARLIRNIRLDKAHHLLTHSLDMRVSEAMLAVGLNDAKNFALIFKERFSVSPRDLKQPK
jgi:DNA-binding response OmpR family regulator